MTQYPLQKKLMGRDIRTTLPAMKATNYSADTQKIEYTKRYYNQQCRNLPELKVGDKSPIQGNSGIRKVPLLPNYKKQDRTKLKQRQERFIVATVEIF